MADNNPAHEPDSEVIRQGFEKGAAVALGGAAIAAAIALIKKLNEDKKG